MSVNVVLKSVFDDRGIKQAQKSFGSVGNSLGKLAKGLTAAFSVAAVANFGKAVVSQASNLAESVNAVNVSFGQNAEGIKKLGEEAATSLGLSTQQFNQLAVGFTAFAEKIAGPGGDVVATLDELTTRGADFASVMNLDVNEAMTIFRSGLAGETEPLRRFGIDVSEAAVKAYAYANGIAETGATLTEAQKIQARYGAIMEQTNKFAGDFANTSDGLANAQRILKAEFANVQAEIGGALLPALQALVPALTPIVEQMGPLLTRIFEALSPIIVTLANSLEPLFKALEPLFKVFELVAGVMSDIIDTILPPLIQFIGILTPVFQRLAEAIIPLVQKFLPVFARLLDAMMPFIEILADYIIDVWIPALEMAADVIGDYLIGYLETFAEVLEYLGPIFEDLWSKAKPFFGGLDDASEKQPKILNFINGIKDAFIRLKEQLGPLGLLLNPIIKVLEGLSEKATPKPVAASNSGVLDAYQYNLLTNPIVTPIIPIEPVDPKDDPAGKTKDTYDKVRKVILKAQAEIVKSERDYARTKFEINRDYEDKVAALREDAAQKQLALIDESKARITSAFRSATQIGLGDLFSAESTRELETQVKQLTSRLTVSVTKETEKTAYSSVTDIINGLRDRLTASKTLLANASELAALGFKQTFIEQVLETGAETGNALSSAIIDAGPETQRELQSLFTELETVSETGANDLAQSIYDKFKLATRELNAQSAIIKGELDALLEEQDQILLRSLADAAWAFSAQISDIKTQFELDLLDFGKAFAGLGNTIDSLRAKFERLLAAAGGNIQAALIDPKSDSILAGATVADRVDIKNIANGSGIVIDELSDVAGTLAYLQARITAGKSYIKNVGANTALGIDAASRVSGFEKELATLQGAAAAGTAAGTVININVRTDTTQSQAMVGKTIGNIVTKYVTTGGQVLVSGS